MGPAIKRSVHHGKPGAVVKWSPQNKIDAADWLVSTERSVVAHATVSAGAHLVEPQIILDRASWGSDQMASLEPQDFRLLSRIRAVDAPLRDDMMQPVP